MATAPWIVSDELWELVEPLLPKKERRYRYPGRKRLCWRRLDEWQRAGVWERLHATLLSALRAKGEIEWSRAVVDSSQIQAKKGAPKRARARSTEGVRAPSTTFSSTARGSRSPGRSRAAIATTSPS